MPCRDTCGLPRAINLSGKGLSFFCPKSSLGQPPRGLCSSRILSLVWLPFHHCTWNWASRELFVKYGGHSWNWHAVGSRGPRWKRSERKGRGGNKSQHFPPEKGQNVGYKSNLLLVQSTTMRYLSPRASSICLPFEPWAICLEMGPGLPISYNWAQGESAAISLLLCSSLLFWELSPPLTSTHGPGRVKGRHSHVYPDELCRPANEDLWEPLAALPLTEAFEYIFTLRSWTQVGLIPIFSNVFRVSRFLNPMVNMSKREAKEGERLGSSCK